LNLQAPPFIFNMYHQDFTSPNGRLVPSISTPSILSGLTHRLSALALVFVLVFFVFLESLAHAFPVHMHSGQQEREPQNEAQLALQKRLEAVRAARASGDPARVSQTSTLVIALALRELAQLRLLEGAYPQAVQLYRRSLDFEDVPGTHIDLAIALVGAEQPDAAIGQVDQFLPAHPDDVRALTVLGRAWMLEKNYQKAKPPLTRVASLAPGIDSLYSLASCLLDSHDARDKAHARQVFEDMIRLVGDSGSLHVMFGRAYRDAGYMPDAVSEFQHAITINPRTPHAHYFLGLARLSMNAWAPTPAVRAEFAKELQYYPNDYLANYMIGFVDSSQREYASSNLHLKLASQLNPDAPEPWLYLGLNAYEQGNMKFAESCFRRAIALTGTDESRALYQIRRAYIDLGRILVTSGRKEEGEKLLAKARELQNKVFEVSQQQIGAHLLEGGAGAAAVVQPLSSEAERQAAPLSAAPADPFAQLDPSALAHAHLTEDQKRRAELQEKSLRSILAISFNDLGTSEAIAKVYRSAEGHFQEAERWDPKIPGLYRNLGVAAYRLGDYPEAIRTLPLALAEKPSDSPLRAMLGLSYFASNRFADAVKAFTPLGEAGMRDPVAGYAWADSLTQLGDLQQASRVLIEVQKNNLPPDTLLLVGQLWISIEDYAHAVATFQHALALNPSLLRAHYYEGVADLRWEHQTEAETQFEAELKLNPDDAEAKDNLGFLYLEKARRDDAAAIFRSVLESHPDDATAHYQLGKILLEEGKLNDAISQLEQAARLSPNTDYIHYQLQAAYRKASRIEDADRELEIYKEIKARKRASAAASGMGDNP
jgi:tetratricopeptide (TPR) repeat protein